MRARGSDRIADAFLTHDRPIHRRCEDSVVRATLPIRRSRGHAPESVPLPVPAERPLVAAGAELEEHFLCRARLGRLPLAASRRPRLGGRLSSLPTDLDLYLQMLGVEPEVVAYDLHPEYLATKWALEQEAELVGVQHHHAHARGLSRRARRGRPRARARLRRHRLRHRRHALGRRAPAVRPRCLRARSRTSSRCRCPAARPRSGSPGASLPRTSSVLACRSAGSAGSSCARA